MRRLNKWAVWLFPRRKNGQNMDLASYFHPELNSGLFTPSPPWLYKHLRKNAYSGTTITLELQTFTNWQQVVYQNRLECEYTCLTQLYVGRDMYNLLHKNQLHVSAIFIGHLQVDN